MLRRLAWPAGLVLLVAILSLPAVRLPGAVNETLPWWPVLLSGVAALLGLTFGLGRLVMAGLAVFLAAVAVRLGPVPHHLVALLLPANLALFALWRERPLISESGALRLFVLIFQAVLAIRLAHTHPELLRDLSEWSPSSWSGETVRASVMVSLVVSGLVLTGLTVVRGDALSQGGLAAASLGCWGVAVAEDPPVLLAGAAAALVIAGLFHAWRLAFQDGLTGLAARRTLDARLRGLSGDYALAMVDVDHFKRLNDTHGHDAGDQVLRMVARHLEAVPGARAYRYGGEEFALVFPGSDSGTAAPALESLRGDIAAYPFRVRGISRPGDRRGRRKRGSGGEGEGTLRVTVSIGLADTETVSGGPGAVLEAADEALYRAKRSGRDRVSRKGRSRGG